MPSARTVQRRIPAATWERLGVLASQVGMSSPMAYLELLVAKGMPLGEIPALAERHRP